IASKYEAAPQAKVTVKPNWIAITMARTEPRTLAAAFIAQAHSTALSAASCSRENSDFDDAANKRKTVGKGIPITNPRGIKSAAATSSRDSNPKPTRAAKRPGRTNR